MAGPKMIDPETGLELTVLQPAPPMYGRDSARGRAEAQAANPFLAAIPSTTGAPPVLTPPPAPAPVAIQPLTAAAPAPLPPSTFSQKLSQVLFGTPDSKLSPEEESAKHQRRQDASQMARSSANDPGAAFMEIPSAGGNSLGESLQFIPALLKGLGLGG
jgi:hypothetical protein